MTRLVQKHSSNPATACLGVSPEDLRARSGREICPAMFIAVLFTVAKRWKQLRCLSRDERMSKMGSIHITGFYSAL